MSHISFSELKTWYECPFKHKLRYLDKLKGFVGNEYTAFGNAIHDTCELLLTEGTDYPHAFFLGRFDSILGDLRKDGVPIKENMVSSMKDQARPLVDLVLPALEDYFGEYEVVSAEENLYEPIANHDTKYKGFVDLVLKTPDGKYHVIDWKSCSWGWDARKKNEKMVTYQLTYYKHFFANKHGIDSDKVRTYFALLKRTATKNQIEIFKVTSGQRKTDNAINLLTKALYNISNKTHPKNKLSCRNCEFYKTEHCP